MMVGKGVSKATNVIDLQIHFLGYMHSSSTQIFTKLFLYNLLMV